MVLNNERSRWRKQKNGLSQGSVCTPSFSTSTLTTSLSTTEHVASCIYADDLCVTAQQPSFEEVEIIEEALSELTQYYRSNNMRANPDKPQVTAFHLRNKEAMRTLKL